MATSFSGGGRRSTRREWIQYTGRRVGRNLALGEKLKNSVCFISFYIIWFLPVLEKLITIIYEIVIIFVKLQTDYRYLNSHFFPSTTKLWNLLGLRIRQLPNFESFKYKLKKHYFKNAKLLSFYNIGNRYLNILHTRIRNNCSALHNTLFHTNLIHSTSCSCGYSTENAEHFFLLQEVWSTNIYFVPFFISCEYWLEYIAVWKPNLYIFNIDTNRHVFSTVQIYI